MECVTNLEEGMKKISETRRPGMVIIHKSTCSSCVQLKPKFLASKEINNLSHGFVVISVLDRKEPLDPKWLPDGKYVPRIFFVDTSGHIMKDIINTERNSKYRYFGNTLRWETNLEAGIQKVVARQKPGMIVFHKTWCGACRALKPKVDASRDIHNLSNGFVLISLAEDDHPRDERFMPDGDYVPRVLFLGPNGNLLFEVVNEGGSTEYKYFYSDAESIARSMKTVLYKYPDT